MITKTGNMLIKKANITKESNFILGHALQNLFGRASLKFPKALGTEKIFLRNMVKPDQGMPTAAGNALFWIFKRRCTGSRDNE